MYRVIFDSDYHISVNEILSVTIWWLVQAPAVNLYFTILLVSLSVAKGQRRITCIVVGQWPKALMSFDSYNWLKPFNRMVEEPQFMNQDDKGQNLFNHSSKIAARITARLIAKNYIKMFHEHQLAQLILTSRYASTFRYFCPNPNKNYCKLSWKAIGLIRSNLINICHLHYF